MNQTELLNKLEQILEDAKAGIMSTIDQNGHPRMRWMTPATIKGRPGVLFTVTCPYFSKISHLKAHPEVEWMLQTRSLDQIINIKGKVNILDNPAIKAEILEAIGSRLTVFWSNHCDSSDFIVLETVIEEATYFLPMKGWKETISFHPEVPSKEIER